MGLFGGDFGLSELIYEKLSRFRKRLPRSTRKLIAKFVTNTVSVFSVAGPVMTIPQVIKIYTEHNVEGFSMITWISYIFLSVFWINYGLLIRSKPIVIANTCWLLVHSLTIIGMVLYG